MPHKNPEDRRVYVRDWKRRKRQGLATRTTPLLTASEQQENKRQRNRDWEAENPDKVTAKRVRWNALNVDEKRDHNLRKRYGITLEALGARIALQGGACACCRRPLNLARPRSIHVDHDHETGEIRGILHAGCNTAIGNLGDDVEGVTRALVYVSGATAPTELIDEHW